MVLVLGMAVEEDVFREDWMGSMFTCNFLSMCVLNTFGFQYFCVSSLVTPATENGSKS